jgi:hypothetical protein
LVGYALVCADSASYSRWSNRRAARFIVDTFVSWAARDLDHESGRFYAARARDTFALWDGRRRPPMPVHAHVNVEQSARSGTAARLLRDHIDERARHAGAPGWYGEMNAPAGTRERTLGRLGLEVVRRRPNRTFSWATSTPEDRLTLDRRLGPEPAPPLTARSTVG